MSIFTGGGGNSTVKIDDGGDQDVYLCHVKIGNFPRYFDFVLNPILKFKMIISRKIIIINKIIICFSIQ